MTHTERDRAESFGDDAELYEQVRPGYPPALVADLVGGAHLDVLDVGCGTGKAGRAFSAAGCTVLGVEIDERMAAVARSSGLEVEVGSFESWDQAGRSFDLVACGQAWHWVDPVIGPARAASLLREGGRLALFWNYRDPISDPEEAAALAEIYQREAPRLAPENSRIVGLYNHADTLAGHIVAIDASACFGPCRLERYNWQVTHPTQRFIELLSTHSEHRVLEVGVRERLFEALGRLYDERGGEVALSYTTFCIVAPRR